MGEFLTPPWITAGGLAVTVVLLAVLLVRARAAAREARRTERDRTAEYEDRLRGVLGTQRQAVVVHDRAGVVRYANQAAAEVFGLAAGGLPGLDLAHLPARWHTENGQETVLAAVLAAAPTAPDGSRADRDRTVRFVPQDGSPPRWLAVHSVPLAVGNGPVEVVTTFTDVTGHHETRAALARSEEQFRHAMENMPVGIVILDPLWCLVRVNPAFADMLGTSPTALLGRDLSALSHPEDRAVENAAVRSALDGEQDRFTLETRYQRADGRTLWVVLDVELVRKADGSPDHFVAQARDVTDTKLQSEVLAHRAMHDPLTGLANRALVLEELARMLAEPDPEPAPEDAAPTDQLLSGAPDEYSRVGDLVDGFPIELLPVPGDAVLLVTSAVPVGESTVQEVSLNFRTDDTVDEILELYRSALLAVGFSEIPPTSAQSELAAETTFVRSDGSELVAIGVLEVDGGRTVAIGGRVETATP